ncbi:unnamed protein product [Acanthosepion pharaonis]|uniref:CBM21 domain-containing protein n=1 Tax=Acanthosepion pharaonis TaxID=158019 RepID=A0A812C5I3_ACAPH|nr:unnamed protein product [Sepia pharaonis]
MGCCRADDDENGDFTHSAKHQGEETPIASSSKPVDLHVIERQPENGYQERAPSFEQINQLLASPTKIGAHLHRDIPPPPPKPVVTVYPKPQHVPPGFADDSVIRELKERFKSRSVSKHISIDDTASNSDDDDRQPILFKRGGRPSPKIYVPSYTTEVRPLENLESRYRAENVTVESVSTPLAGEVTHPIVEVKLSPVIEITSNVSELVETQPELAQKCICIEQSEPKHLITANIEPAEQVHESILVDSTSDRREESILENLRNQAISLQENEEVHSVPLDYINQGFNHSSGSLHKEEKTVVEKDSNGGYKVFKQCFISTLVHDNEGFTDSSQNISDSWNFSESDIPDYDRPLPSPPNSQRPKFQISANSSYTTLDEDQLVQVRISDNAANKRYSNESSDSFSEMSQEQSETLLPKDYLHEDDEDDEDDDEDDDEEEEDNDGDDDDDDDDNDDADDDADDENPFPDVLFPSIDSNIFLNNKRSLDSESEHLVVVSPSESSTSHSLPLEADTLVSKCPAAENGSLLVPQRFTNEETTLTPHSSLDEPVNNMSGHECPLEISDFVDQTITSCINAVQNSITEGSLFSDRPLSPDSSELSTKHILTKMVSFEEEDTPSKSFDSVDTDPISGPPSDLPQEGERMLTKRVSFDNNVKSISPPGFSSSSSPDKDGEEESTRKPISGEILLEKYHHPNTVDDDDDDDDDDDPSPPAEFPSPPDELLDFRELLDTEGFCKEEIVGASETTLDHSYGPSKQNFHQMKSTKQTRSLDFDESTHLLESTYRSKSLDESTHHSFCDDHLSANENVHLIDTEDQLPKTERTEASDYLQNLNDGEFLDQSNTSDYYSSGDREQHSLEYAQHLDFPFITDKKKQNSFLDEEEKLIHEELIDFETEIDTSASSHEPQPESHASHMAPRLNRAGSFEFEDIVKDLSSFKSDFSLDTSSDTEVSSNLFSYSDIIIDPLSHNEPPVTISDELHGNFKTSDQVNLGSPTAHPEPRPHRKIPHELECIAATDPNENKVILEPYIGYPNSKATDLMKSDTKSETSQFKTNNKNADIHQQTQKCIDLDKDDTSEGEFSDQESFDVPLSSYPPFESKVAEKVVKSELLESAMHETGELISFVDLESVASSQKEPETEEVSLQPDKIGRFQVTSDLETGESSLLPNAGLRRQSTLKTSEMFTEGLMDELKNSLSSDSKKAEVPRITMTSPNGSTTSSSRSSSPRSSISDISESESKETSPPQQTFSLRFRQPAADYVSFRNRLENTYVSLENVLLRGNIILGTVKVKSFGGKRSVFLRCTFNAWETSVDVPATHTPSSFPNQYETYSFALTMPVAFQDTMRVIFAVCYKTDDFVYWDNNDGLNYEIVSTHSVQKEMISSFRSSNQETVPRPYPGVLKKGSSTFVTESTWNPASAIKETKNIRKSAICLNVSKPSADYITFKSRLERDFVALEHVFNKDFMLTGSIKVKNIEGEKKVFIRCSFDCWVTFIDVPASLSDEEYSCPYKTYTFEMNVPTVFNTKMQFAVCFEANGNVYWDNNAGKNYQICFFDMYTKMKVDSWKGQ